MPILKPEIQAALREAGLSKDSTSLTEKLDRADLSVDDAIVMLGDIARGGDTAQRQRALDTILKLHGVLKDVVQVPQVTIIINDPDGPKGINPILIPREKTIVQ